MPVSGSAPPGAGAEYEEDYGEDEEMASLEMQMLDVYAQQRRQKEEQKGVEIQKADTAKKPEVKMHMEMDKKEERNTFHHPYKPYPIQLRFMEELYDCLEKGKVGIFESPTGTGKSLSILCASLTWLRDHKRAQFSHSAGDQSGNQDEPAWMVEYATKTRRETALRRQQEFEKRLAKIREAEERESRQRQNQHRSRDGDDVRRYKRQKTRPGSPTDGDDEREFELDEYDSDQEVKAGRATAADNMSAETRALMLKLGLIQSEAAKSEDDLLDGSVRIYYCSRTHSQLSQFIHEARRITLSPVILPDPEPHPNPPEKDADAGADSTSGGQLRQIEESLKHVTLGSRKNLCINRAVKRLANPVAMNERCVELQKPSVPKDRRCRFLPSQDPAGDEKVAEFRHHVFSAVRDIEDLGSVGEKLGVCPYYASRGAVKSAELVTLPYPLLLQKSSRDALDLSVKDSVVIIDEAHNLIDAINNAYSASISLSQLDRSRDQLRTYVRKFGARLTGKNRVYVTQTVRILNSVHACLSRVLADAAKATPGKETGADGHGREGGSGESGVGVLHPAELLAGEGVDQINLFKLSRYLTESKLARKIDGYDAHVQQEMSEVNGGSSSASARRGELQIKSSPPTLLQVQQFLLTLMNPSEEGRFFYETGRKEESLAVSDSGSDPRSGAPAGRPPGKKAKPDDVTVRYVLLDPVYHFRDIVHQARAVILAGGTMSPMSDYFRFLFPYVDPGRMHTLSCEHVIPPENVAAWPVGVCTVEGPGGGTLGRTGGVGGSGGAGGGAGTVATELDFTFSKRSSERLIADVGAFLVSLVATVPDGVVVFFPSYAYLATCVAQWKRKRPVQVGRRDGAGGGAGGAGCGDAAAGDGVATDSLFDRMNAIKPVFYESRTGDGADGDSNIPHHPHRYQKRQPQNGAPDSGSEPHRPAEEPSSSSSVFVESVLSAYTAAIRSPPPDRPHRGALLLSVIGGSLSEGINFSDELGRCVVVLGLPFPNPHSPEWKARMGYISAKTAEKVDRERAAKGGETPGEDGPDGQKDGSGGFGRCGTAASASTPAVLSAAAVEAGKAAAREFYENTTIRAVNQAIGRAIRHKDDYATIVLLDKRYGTDRIRTKLPGWINKGLRAKRPSGGRGPDGGSCAVETGVVLAEVAQFFERKGVVMR